MKKEKVLVITDNFPGRGGRNFGLIKYLNEFGLETIILTNKNRANINEQKILNASNFNPIIYKSFCINRTPFRVFSKYFKSLKLKKYFENLFFIPDLYITWVPFALRKAIYIVNNENIKTVITISPPESIHIIGLIIKKIKYVKWIANFEDLWTTKKIVYKPPTYFHDKIIKKLEKCIYINSTHIIANTKLNKEIYINKFNISSEKIDVISLGYDKNDIRSLNQIKKGNNIFTIGYMGHFDKPGFPWEEVLYIIKEINISKNKQIMIDVCGPISEHTKIYMKKNGLDKYIKHYGTLSHKEAIHYISKSDVLLLFMYETSYSKAIVPQKLYHYLLMSKPIIAITEEGGEVENIIANTKTGVAVSIKNKDLISKYIIKYYMEWEEKGIVKYEPNVEEKNKYDIKNMSYEFSEIIKKINGRS